MVTVNDGSTTNKDNFDPSARYRDPGNLGILPTRDQLQPVHHPFLRPQSQHDPGRPHHLRGLDQWLNPRRSAPADGSIWSKRRPGIRQLTAFSFVGPAQITSDIPIAVLAEIFGGHISQLAP